MAQCCQCDAFRHFRAYALSPLYVLSLLFVHFVLVAFDSEHGVLAVVDCYSEHCCPSVQPLIHAQLLRCCVAVINGGVDCDDGVYEEIDQ